MTGRRGFSLLEGLIAMTIASVLVILVSSVFLAQNSFYASSLARSRADDAVRTAAEFLSRELRTTQVGGVVTAERRRMVVRVPLAVGGVCDQSGSSARLYVPGAARFDTSAVAGYAIQDSLGAWAYTAGSWSSWALASGPTPASVCESNGVDTTGVIEDFILMSLTATAEGDLVMVYQEVEYQFAPSQLDPGTLALLKGQAADTLVELASGFRSSSQFEYLVGGSFSTSVSTGLDSIREVRLTLAAAGEGDSTSTDGFVSSATVRVPLAGSR